MSDSKDDPVFGDAYEETRKRAISSSARQGILGQSGPSAAAEFRGLEAGAPISKTWPEQDITTYSPYSFPTSGIEPHGSPERMPGNVNDNLTCPGCCRIFARINYIPIEAAGSIRALRVHMRGRCGVNIPLTKKESSMDESLLPQSDRVLIREVAPTQPDVAQHTSHHTLKPCVELDHNDERLATNLEHGWDDKAVAWTRPDEDGKERPSSEKVSFSSFDVAHASEDPMIRLLNGGDHSVARVRQERHDTPEVGVGSASPRAFSQQSLKEHWQRQVDRAAHENDWGATTSSTHRSYAASNSSSSFSYADSVLSTTSFASSATELSKHSIYSADQIARATKELIIILQEDTNLATLYRHAIQDASIGPERLERNLRRLFKSCAHSLDKAGSAMIELDASQLAITARTISISDSLREKFDQFFVLHFLCNPQVSV
ncbi:hypothetical protein HBI40_114520 [Parastagonospora nodorum]|nr:hypothetical protein HBI40_114520 [Parastagonospora nodorum]